MKWLLSYDSEPRCELHRTELEAELRGELNDALFGVDRRTGIPSPGDSAKLAGGNVRTWIRELRVVEEIEEVRADLQPDPLGYRRGLGKRHIDVRSSRTAEEVARQRSICAQGRIGHHLGTRRVY